MTQFTEATVHDRQIIISVSEDIPDGAKVEVRVIPVVEQVGLDESQWKTDDAAMKKWNDWLTTIEPIDFLPTTAFDQQFKKFNVEAVREQMLGGEQ